MEKVIRKSLQDIGMTALIRTMFNFVGNDPIVYVRGLSLRTEEYEKLELGIGTTFACI